MPASRTLVDLLAERVTLRPDQDAFAAGERRMTYGQFWSAIQHARGALAAHGVTPGDRVAVLMRNSPEYAAAYYGVLSAGGVVVPLNHEAKARDLAAWIRHAGARLLLADETHPEREELSRQLGDDVRILLAEAVGQGAVTHEDALVPEPDGLASIIYTSGTTGEPKGVMLSHRNLVSNVLAIIEYLHLAPSDRVVAVLPFFYSYGNSVLHSHLAAGATLILEAGMMYPQLVVDAIQREGATGFSGVPGMFRTLLGRAGFNARELPTLRYFTQAGAAMSPADVERMRAAFPKVDFFVMYGQTEATARLTYLPPDELTARRGSAGVAIPSVRIEVRRADGALASPGEAGEVHAAGPNIMLGYWKADAATTAVIADEPSGRWLRTGDLGYRDSDGFLFLVGRSSEIIKTGAHRVSPVEIEEAVLRLEGTAEAAACGVPDDQLGEAIQVVIVPRPGAQLTERTVLAHCRRELSLYKVPKKVVFAAHLPRTSSGKIRRRSLADPAALEAITWAH